MRFDEYTQYLKEAETVVVDGGIESHIGLDFKTPEFESDLSFRIYESPRFEENGVLYAGATLKLWNVPAKKKIALPGLSTTDVSPASTKELARLIPKLRISLKQISEDYIAKVKELFEEAGFVYGTEAELKAIIDKQNEPEPEEEEEEDGEDVHVDHGDLDDFADDEYEEEPAKPAAKAKAPEKKAVSHEDHDALDI